MQIGHKISQLRNRKNISQKKLAADINVSPGLVGLWETHKRLPSLECFISLIDYFEVSADLLLEGDRKLKPGQYENTFTGVPADSRKIMDTFSQLNEDNRDILIGEAKKLLKSQRSEEKRETLTALGAT